MKTIITSIALISSLSFVAQTRVAEIEYTETVKMGKVEMPEGMDLSGMLPESMSSKKILIFDSQKSVYIDSEKQEEEEDTEITSDDGTIQINFRREESTSILYMDLEKKEKVHQQGFMGKSFIVTSEIQNVKWKIEAEKISYLGYECTKATGENENGDKIVAWFSSQIPVQCGPGAFQGLPGLILMISVNDGKREIKATSIEIEEVNTEKIKIPKDGKKVTEEDFEKIQAEKREEMNQKYGGNSFIIRN